MPSSTSRDRCRHGKKTEAPKYPFRLFVLLLTAVIVISAYKPYNWPMWFAHGIWVFIGLPLLIATHRRFPFTTLAYLFLLIYGSTMMIGAHFTYEHEPVFAWLRDSLHLSRNHYDRFAHFWLGATSAIILREILVRRRIVLKRNWTIFLVIATSLSIGAGNEIIEWWFAVAVGKSAAISLGMQGDVWDTQWDMMIDLIGAVAAISIGGLHDRQLRNFTSLPATSVSPPP